MDSPSLTRMVVSLHHLLRLDQDAAFCRSFVEKARKERGCLEEKTGCRVLAFGRPLLAWHLRSPSKAARAAQVSLERFLTRPVSRLGALGVRVLVAALRCLSPGLRRVLAFGLGRVAFALGIRRRITLENLRHAFPERTSRERRRMARASYGHVFLSALEGICGHILDKSTPMELVNWHLIEEKVKGGEGGGALIASAHFGSWELMAELLAARGMSLAAVVRPLSGAFNARLFEARKEAGMELIHPRGALRQMLKALREGKVVVQLVDQSLSAERAVFVPFFGRMTATAPALSMAAVAAGVPAYLVLSERVRGGMRVWVEGPFGVAATGDNKSDVALHVAQVTAALEAHIRRCPEQWMWMHRRWKVPYTPQG